MDSIILISSSRIQIPIYNPQNPKPKHLNPETPSTINLNPKTSSFSLSHQTPFNLKTLKIKCSCYRQPITPFRVLAPVLHAIRSFTISSFFNGGFSLRNRTDFGDYVQSGGIGTVLLSTTILAKGHISPFVTTLSANPTFVSGMCAWAIAQSMKVFLNFFVERRWDFRILFTSGGMPSSHSALCTALSTSVAICHGVRDSLFPVCLGFSLIVMYDAIGVRRHAGMQAEVLNMIVEDLFQGHPISQRKLKELLGHTPSQVIAGALLGFLVACFCSQGCLVAV